MAEDTPTLIFSVLEHLAALERDHPTESRDALTRAVSSLSEAFNLDIEDPSKERKFSLKPHTLATIFAEGARVLGAKSAAQTSAELQSNDAFKQFIKTVSSKGYFKGVEEGTLEYDERMSKLVAKFKERTEAVSGAPVEEAGTSIPPAVAPASSAGAVPATGAKAAKEKQAEEVSSIFGRIGIQFLILVYKLIPTVMIIMRFLSEQFSFFILVFLCINVSQAATVAVSYLLLCFNPLAALCAVCCVLALTTILVCNFRNADMRQTYNMPGVGFID